MQIDLYTIHCPKCEILEEKLNLKNLHYTVHTDIEEMNKLGFETVPMLSVDGEIKNYKEAVDWLKTLYAPE